MKKPVRVCEKNREAIEAALREVNGDAVRHTYTRYGSIERIATIAEHHLLRLVGTKAKAYTVGARWCETSGDPVSNVYARKAHTRVATAVWLERRATGWFLQGVGRAEIWRQGGGAGKLFLTPAQAERAHRVFQRQFVVVEV